MSKHKGKKRTFNRKFKRTIRYTVAALFMVTAIIVAAIPAQTNRADEGSGSSTPASTDDRDTEYSYEVTDDRTLASGSSEPDSAATGGNYYTKVPVGNSIDLSKYHRGLLGPGEIQTGYSVVKLSNGYYLNWQYKYYYQGETGVLCDYNDDFAVKEQTLSLRLPTDYLIVDPSVVTAYFETGDGSIQQSFSYADTFDETSREYQKFMKYNTTLFSEWLKECEQYRRDYANYLIAKDRYDNAIDHTGMTEPTAPTVPADCTFYPSGLSLEMRRQYYCDYALSYDGSTGMADRGSFTLIPVQDARAGSITDSYLVQALSMDGLDSTLTAKLDTNNFLCSGVSERLITAIGDYAFFNVRNIETMNMPAEIAYVGDYAFFNSFIKHVNLSNVKTVGNAAFKSTQLESVNLGTGLTIIGSEAFANNTKLTSVEFPVTITDIRAGAFASCLSLGHIDLSTINSNFAIGAYCFYDCQSLSGIVFPDGVTNKNLQSIGKGALSVAKGSTSDAQLSVEFPSNLTDLPDLLFAGRSNLQSVTFPASYGSAASSQRNVPKNMFLGCTNLASVKFPDSCLYVKYESENFEFYDVQNPDFYVEGPALLANRRDYAYPREATWYEKTYVNDFVPYRFTLDGVEYYETGSKDGDYILTVDNSGKLNSCVKAPGNTSSSIDLVIPDKVGAYKVISVEEGCFDTVKDSLKTVTVSDDSISEIGSRAFENCPYLEAVTIGNSVSRVGDSAFANCPKLKNVTFHTPSSGYNNFSIGSNAFETKSTELTFHADIVKGYAPFDWAMEPDNYVDSQTGVRVCYQSQSPTYLKVMYDKNQDGEITLIDYPKYDRLDKDHEEHNREMEQYYYKIYGDDDYDAYRKSFAQACINAYEADNTLTAIPESVYESDYYGPWIVPELASGTAWNDLLQNSYTGSGTVPSIPCPDAYYSNGRNTYSILKNAEGTSDRIWESLTPEEADWVYACLNIDVPEAVTSLDVNTFINGTSDGRKNYNSNNVQTYINTNGNGDAYKMYQKNQTVDGVEVVGGLFSGQYDDGTDCEAQTVVKGNDYVQSVTLRGIKSLPDYCFDNCESLTSVNLGDNCTDAGTAPFRGCPNLTSVGANSNYYICDNGIFYEVLNNGYYKIKECLASRGMGVGQPLINSTNDSLVPKVSQIEPGAFQECDGITYVDLTDATSLQEIPENGFRNCESLSYVVLPETVNSIQDNAFAENDRVDVTIPGKEVFIATSAFEHKPTVNIRTYKDTSAYEYGTYYGQTVTLIGELYRVIFLDHDGTQIGETQYIEEGKNATPPADPTWEGHTFSGWSGDYNGITQDTILVAQYYANGSSDDPNNNGGNGGNNGGNSGNNSENGKYTLTVVNGTGGGTYAAGTAVIISANNPPTGKVFYNWTMSTTMNIVSSRSAATTITMPESNATVTANYIDSGSSYLTVSSNEVQPLKNSSVSGNNKTTGGSTTNTVNRDTTGGTKVSITKPGISNRDLASAVVNGSTDNFIVKISDSALATEEVQKALLAKYGSLDAIRYVAMDISLYDSTGTTKITDTTGLTVDITIPLPDDLIPYAGNNKTGAVVNGQLEELTPKFTTIDGVACVTLRATHFSPYTIYADTNNLVSGLDETPKTGDGIAPKWFLSIGFAAISILLFMKKDKPVKRSKLA